MVLSSVSFNSTVCSSTGSELSFSKLVSTPSKITPLINDYSSSSFSHQTDSCTCPCIPCGLHLMTNRRTSDHELILRVMRTYAAVQRWPKDSAELFQAAETIGAVFPSRARENIRPRHLSICLEKKRNARFTFTLNRYLLANCWISS